MHMAIVGAGVCGLMAARELQSEGHDVRVFDKARGPGGRMATRREGVLAYDHGAPSFTAQGERFRDCVDAWIGAGVAATWDPRVVRAGAGRLHAVDDREAPRFVGVPRMSAITRHLARGLDVVVGSHVQRIIRVSRGWDLATEAGPLGHFDAVLVTTPPEQAAALLGEAPELACVAARVPSEPCWAVMAAFREPLPTSFDAAHIDDGPLVWAARDSSKPGRSPEETWVLHAGAAWSRRHAAEAPDVVAGMLLQAFFDGTGVSVTSPTCSTAHRWLLARATRPLDQGACWDVRARIGVAGDWCQGGDVEGAALSAWAVTRHLSLMGR